MRNLTPEQLRDAGAYVGRFSHPEILPDAIDDGDTPDVPRWPDPPDAAAFFGVAGDFVRAILPASEGDAAALLVSFLVAAGSMIGRHVYYQVEGDRHYCNLFGLIVGATGQGRKGTSWGRVKEVLKRTDPCFALDNVKTGLSTGEGLISHVRDAGGETEDPQTGKVEMRDPGVADKRLLVYESEFARPVTLMEREGNTLSATLRGAWDSGDMATMTKRAALRATGAHISIVAHITPEELRRKLKSVDLTNGFANRFLFVVARRSKHLPFGGHVPEDVFDQLAHQLHDVVRVAAIERRLEFNTEARALWEHAYLGELDDIPPGLLGAATSRAAAQVLRLACVYAVLDRTQQIERPHLEAALAVWRYARESAAFVLGHATGHPDADRILRALEDAPDGLTRTEISDLFKRNKPTPEIAEALRYLQDCGKAHQTPSRGGVRGRPPERWRCTKETKETRQLAYPQSSHNHPGDGSFLSSNSFTPSSSEAAAGDSSGSIALGGNGATPAGAVAWPAEREVRL